MGNDFLNMTKTNIIANFLIAAVIFLFAGELYALFQCKAPFASVPSLISMSRIAAIIIIFALIIRFRSIEKNLIIKIETQKEELLEKAISDMSHKLQIEEQLLKEYKEAIDNSAIVAKIDREGKLTYVNRRFCELSEYSEEELIGESYFITKHPDDYKVFFRYAWITVLSKKTYAGKIRGKSKSGKEFLVEATITPILGANDEIEEYVAIMFDVTKEAELEKNLFEKAAKEQEERHKSELAKARESFLLVFTHELKTPLNAIINFSSFIRKKLEKSNIDDKERLTELLVGIKQNGEDMLIAVSNTLDVAKLKSKKMVFSSSVFDLSRLSAEVCSKILPPSDFKRSLKIEEHITVKGDELRIGQIISNIISNAVKYGNGEISVELKSVGDKFLLCVEDNGFGVKDKEHAFELFWTDEHDTTRASKGTGIGLYFAKMLCEEFGFELTLGDSKKLTGACFCVSGPKTEVHHD